ncbi:bifunctional riboflavin kinase/FAD synthetase [Aphanothece hegewaldii CCALA 016]|uniref:Riboflavin biosynthesis protein n=1 Tax=Aphanothece hegewaldii CCALA 016 TaxID=2107694 RepID=A0A2T1LXT8_9CHRO|nr:bifunctional riboflavin kinase/FAD synthetase [Aphanothece hegewaldii]PSF37208.1 bifunctional riboflavin kinase/FAD synthetase [Aphanothece hegewaldii CCALA 016]
MQIVNSLTSPLLLTPNAIALGNFDGIHLGHQCVFEPILSSNLTLTSLHSTVVTFCPHPQEFFSGQKRQLLTPLPEKNQILEKLGIEQLVLIPFNQELASLSPQQFVEEILIGKLAAKRVSVGEDFRFGYKRLGTAEELKAIAKKYNTEVIITSLLTCFNSRISSSRIRQSLADGDMEQASQMLGRSYSLMGTVIKGQQIGRTIGFSTANLLLPAEKLLPRFGVYCVKVSLKDEFSLPGVMNIGCRPTVEGSSPTIEVHLLDWKGDLYGQTLTVSLEKFLRPEQKFPSLEALKAQIIRDCDQARKILAV